MELTEKNSSRKIKKIQNKLPDNLTGYERKHKPLSNSQLILTDNWMAYL